MASKPRTSRSETPGTDAWLTLKPGDHVKVTSHSGNDYEATIVYAGLDDAGLYVRLGDGKLARLLPGRVDWKTLKRLGEGKTVKPGDDLLMLALGGTDGRGKLAKPLDDRVVFSKASGTEITMPAKEAPTKRFRLLFHTKTLRAGDEFLVKSRSGREIIGRVLEVTDTKITARVRPSKEKVSIKVENLDLASLFVLIPIFGANPTWTH